MTRPDMTTRETGPRADPWHAWHESPRTLRVNAATRPPNAERPCHGPPAPVTSADGRSWRLDDRARGQTTTIRKTNPDRKDL